MKPESYLTKTVSRSRHTEGPAHHMKMLRIKMYVTAIKVSQKRFQWRRKVTFL